MVIDLGRDDVLDQPPMMLDLAQLRTAVRAAAFARPIHAAGRPPGGRSILRGTGRRAGSWPTGRPGLRRGLSGGAALPIAAGDASAGDRRFGQFHDTLVQGDVLGPQSVIVLPQGLDLGGPLAQLPVQGDVVHLQVVELLLRDGCDGSLR